MLPALTDSDVKDLKLPRALQQQQQQRQKKKKKKKKKRDREGEKFFSPHTPARKGKNPKFTKTPQKQKKPPQKKKKKKKKTSASERDRNAS